MRKPNFHRYRVSFLQSEEDEAPIGLAVPHRTEREKPKQITVIIPELQKPDISGYTTISSSLKPEELADTAEGRAHLAERMYRMKQASPEGTEIGMRIDPRTGEPEIYARGLNLNGKDFTSRLQSISSVPISLTSAPVITKDDYNSPKSLLSPPEQTTLSKNGNEACGWIKNLKAGLTTEKIILLCLAASTEAGNLPTIRAEPSPSTNVGLLPPEQISDQKTTRNNQRKKPPCL